MKYKRILLLGMFLLAMSFLLSGCVQLTGIGCKNTYCNDYEFICCGEKKEEKEEKECGLLKWQDTQ